MSGHGDTLDTLETPVLLLDRVRMGRNIQRVAERMEALGGMLRPHVKTHKCLAVTRAVVNRGPVRGLTVSTLQEARYFFDNGYDDILYAVGIVPNKLDRVEALVREGCRLTLTLDSVGMARQVAAEARRRELPLPFLIELDTDGHRSGVLPESPELLAIGEVLDGSTHCELRGVMTHAGESYSCRTPEALLALARQERDRSVLAAERLRAAGLPSPVVSIGSTPTALAIDDLTGVTEVRAGVYVFFDLVMAGIGVCSLDDIALSVLVSVVGHQREREWAITDGGWMALSRDRGTANQAVDKGYGLVLDRQGRQLEGLIVASANQEHGIVARRDGKAPLPYEALPLGGLVRVLPNHACSTAAQYGEFLVMEGDQVVDRWERTRGW